MLPCSHCAALMGVCTLHTVWSEEEDESSESEEDEPLATRQKKAAQPKAKAAAAKKPAANRQRLKVIMGMLLWHHNRCMPVLEQAFKRLDGTLFDPLPCMPCAGQGFCGRRPGPCVRLGG